MAQIAASATSETAVRLRPRGAGAGLKSGGACLGVVDMPCLRWVYRKSTKRACGRQSGTMERRRIPLEAFRRLSSLPPYVFNTTGEMKAEARKRGEDIIDFGMGNPDGATPPHIVAKLIEAAQKTPTHRYSLSRGLPRLRKSICDWYKRRYAVDLNPETEAIVTIGSKEGIAHLCLAMLDEKDTVAVPNPSYPIHIFGPVIAGSKIQSIALDDLCTSDELIARIEHELPRM